MPRFFLNFRVFSFFSRKLYYDCIMIRAIGWTLKSTYFYVTVIARNLRILRNNHLYSICIVHPQNSCLSDQCLLFPRNYEQHSPPVVAITTKHVDYSLLFTFSLRYYSHNLTSRSTTMKSTNCSSGIKRKRSLASFLW